MKNSVIFVWVMALQLCCGATPELFKQKAFTTASFADSANHFISLGEDKAVQELRELALDHTKDFVDHRGEWSVNERIGWMCRVLFEAKTNAFVRPPLFGELLLPYNTMPFSRWPLFPVAVSGSSYFVLSEGYSVAGVRENPKDYIEYCRKEGAFRKTKLPVPTKSQALKDAAALRISKPWTDIRWNDSGKNWSYEMSEEWAWKFIQKQAEDIR